MNKGTHELARQILSRPEVIPLLVHHNGDAGILKLLESCHAAAVIQDQCEHLRGTVLVVTKMDRVPMAESKVVFPVGDMDTVLNIRGMTGVFLVTNPTTLDPDGSGNEVAVARALDEPQSVEDNQFHEQFKLPKEWQAHIGLRRLEQFLQLRQTRELATWCQQLTPVLARIHGVFSETEAKLGFPGNPSRQRGEKAVAACNSMVRYVTEHLRSLNMPRIRSTGSSSSQFPLNVDSILAKLVTLPSGLPPLPK